jgi:hypothetical protein
MTYAEGLVDYGYRHSPERMAYMAEKVYESTDRPFSMEEFVRMEFAESLPGLVKR